MNCILFQPIYQERVWGGRRFQSSLGRQLSSSAPIGESWEVVDRIEANSVVRSGHFRGLSLRQLISQHSAEIMGPDWNAEKPFPILVKWLDCEERLSLQVHPPAAVAPSLKGEPKTENWFVVETWGDSAVMAGLIPEATKQQFEQAIEEQSLEPLVPRLATRPGDSLFVPSGRLHAIDGGNLILEIQQNSDTTYRVYDWGRVGLDGKPRQLHVAESMASIDFTDCAPELLHAEGSVTVLADAAEFKLVCHHLQPGEKLTFAGGVQPRLLSVTSGVLHDRTDGTNLSRGDNALLPWQHAFEFIAEGPVTVLVTEDFTSAS